MGGSSVEMKLITNPITSFCGGTVKLVGTVELEIELGNQNSQEHLTIKSLFNIIDTRLAYNGVIRRPILWETNAVISIRYLTMKIPIPGQVITIKGDQKIAK